MPECKLNSGPSSKVPDAQFARFFISIGCARLRIGARSALANAAIQTLPNCSDGVRCLRAQNTQ